MMQWFSQMITPRFLAALTIHTSSNVWCMYSTTANVTKAQMCAPQFRDTMFVE